MKTAIIALIVLIGLGLVSFFVFRSDDVNTGQNLSPTTTDNNGNGGSNIDDNDDSGDTQPIQTSMVRVSSPLPNSVVRSPLKVTGEARGNWFFEASFPVRLIDANGRQLAIGVAQAKGEWMTTNFVPFEATLTFSNPTTSTGTLILEKDNPSGLPENAAEVRVPVRFSTSSASNQQTVKLYYYDEAKDKDASGNVRCSAQGLVAINRTIPATQTPLRDAIRELLEGPTSAERSQYGLDTLFPLPGVSLTSASISNGVATLTFSDPQNRTGGGSCKVNVLRAQIEATAKQFAGVTSVRIQPSTVFQP